MFLVVATTAALAKPPAPLAVVERGHAWVGVSCEAKKAVPAVEVPWKSSGLMLLTPAGYKTTSFAAPTCFRGECKADEVGVLVGGAADVGVLLDASYAADAKVTPLLEVGTCGLERAADGRVSVCRIYADSREASAWIEVRASGRVQENGYPLYTTIEWRAIESSPSPWIAVPPPYGTSLPRPIGRVSSASRDEVVWLSQEGICCPSESRAWVSYRADGSWTDGTAVSGGKGQPCD